MGVYIKKLITNVKKKQQVELGQKTIIIGKNGAGKSSILNSIELCFGGYVSDFRGKTVKNQRDLFGLSSESDLSVQCTMSNNSKKSISIKKNADGSISKPTVHGKSELSLPIHDITEILEGSSKTFKTWLLRHMGTTLDAERVTEICIENGVDPKLVLTDDLIQSLEVRLESVKDEINKLSDIIRSRAKTIDEFSKTIDTSVDLTAPDKYKDLLAQYDMALQSQTQLQSLLEEEKSLSSVMEQTSQTLLTFRGKLDTLSQYPQLLPTSEEIIAYNIRRDVLQMLDLQQQVNQTTKCLICDGDLHDFDSRRSKLISFNNDMQNKIELLKLKAKSEASIKETSASMYEINVRLEDLGVLIQECKDKVSSLDATDLDHMKSKLDKLKVRNDAVTVYHLRIKEIARVKEEHVQMQDKQKELKKLFKALQSIQTEFVDEAKDKFVDKLNEVLSFKINIYVDEKDIDIGKVESGKICFGLSGAEYMELKFALAQLLYSENSVILSEDKAIDEDRLTIIMEKFSTFLGQVILTSTIRPSTIPSDWKVVEL